MLSGDTGLIQEIKTYSIMTLHFARFIRGDVDALYRDVLNLIFNSNSSGRLYLKT